MIIELLRVVFCDHIVIAVCVKFMIIQLLRVVFYDHTVIASCVL